MLNEGIIKKAIKEAKKSDMPIFKIGAVIFKGNRIISYGHNKKGICGKIHPKYRSKYDSAHAEQQAIINCKNWEKLKGTSILILRVTRSGFLSMSYPCENCMETIKYVGIKEIYYSNHNSEILKENI